MKTRDVRENLKEILFWIAFSAVVFVCLYIGVMGIDRGIHMR